MGQVKLTVTLIMNKYNRVNIKAKRVDISDFIYYKIRTDEENPSRWVLVKCDKDFMEIGIHNYYPSYLRAHEYLMTVLTRDLL